MKLIFCLLSIITIQSWALDSNCPAKNYSNSFGEVRTNGGAQWCWANVAADLIGFNQGVKPPDRISTIDVGLTQFTIGSGALEKVVKNLKSKDVTESLNWFQNKISLHQAYMNETVIHNIGGNPAVAILTYQSRSGYCLEKNLNSSYNSRDSYIYEYFSSIEKRNKIFDSIKETCGEIKDPVVQLQKFNTEFNKKLIEYVEKDLQSQCNPREAMKPMVPWELDINSTTARASDLIKKQIQNGPVAIGIDSNVLYGGAYSNKKSDHGVIVTESRFNKESGACEYRIRDTNGSDCQLYRESLRKKCDSGYVWLTEDEINNSTDRLIGIGPK